MDSSNCRKILLAVDGSDNARAALRWYLTEISRPNDYLLLGHCFESPNLPLLSTTSGISLPAETWTAAIQEKLKNLETLKHALITELIPSRVKNDFVTESCSKAGEGILKIAEDYNCEMIIMGTRGLGSIKRAVYGSVSTYVMHNADRPLIVVPCKEQ